MSKNDDWLKGHGLGDLLGTLRGVVENVNKDSKREYGLPNSETIGVPEWDVVEDSPPCPSCGANLCMVRVRVKQNLIKGGEGTSHYLGCPACQFASPAMIISTTGEQNV